MFFLCCIWKWSANTLPSLIPDTLPIQPHAKNEKKYTKSNRTAINSRWPLKSKLARVFDSVAQSDPLLQFWVSPPNNLNYLSYVRSLLCFTLFPYFPSEVFKRRRTTQQEHESAATLHKTDCLGARRKVKQKATSSPL